MTGKRKTAHKPRRRQPDTLYVEQQPGEDDAQVLARTALSPTVQAGRTLKVYGESPADLDLTSLVGELEKQVKALSDGSLERAEAMLAAGFGVPPEEMVRPDDLAEALRFLLRLSDQCLVPELSFLAPDGRFGDA